MADNYLENRMEQLREGLLRPRHSSSHSPSLDSLLKKNRSHRAFDAGVEVSAQTLREIIGVVEFCASGMNAQPLRFRMVTGEERKKVHPHIHLGAALKGENLPPKGEEPQAYIAVCSVREEDRVVDIDLGIALQSMLLKAVEKGLNGVIVLNFDADKVQKALFLPSKPLALLALGKGTDRIFILEARDPASLAYYRKDGVHYVPKLSTEDIIISYSPRENE